MYLFFCVIQLQELWFFVVGSLMIIMVAIGVLLKGRHCTVVNNLLSAISVPSNIRQTRWSLSCIKHWKGIEFFNFLVFYGPVILCDVLPPQFFDHFILLSNIVFTLNNKVLSESVINEATLLVNRFFYEFSDLHGKENMFYINELF
nr:uncharacterized protein LOC124810896 [Hydra vulgaris]